MKNFGDLFTNPQTLQSKLSKRHTGHNEKHCSFEPGVTYRALLLEYISGYSITEVPRLLTRELVANAVAKLETIHAAGVLHEDTEERNLFLTANGRVMWLDFDSARTNAYWTIPDEYYAGERMYTGEILLENVVRITLS